MSAQSAVNSDIKTQIEMGASLGSILRGERVTQGKSLEDVEHELKIKKNIIDNLESNKFDGFDRPEFLIGYIRSYAKFLKIDSDTVVQCYRDLGVLPQVYKKQSFAKASGFEKTISAKANGAANGFGLSGPKNRDPFAVIGGLFSGIALGAPLFFVVIVLVGAIYFGNQIFGNMQSLELVPSEAKPIIATNVNNGNQQSNDVEIVQEYPQINYEQLYQRQALQTPVVTPRDGRIADIDPSNVGAFDPSTAVPASVLDNGQNTEGEAQLANVPTNLNEPMISITPGIPVVELIPFGQSWVQLTDDEGNVLFEKLLAAGEGYEVNMQGVIPILRAGNASELYMSINGAIYGPIGKNGTHIVKNIAITPQNIDTEYDIITDDMLNRLNAVEQTYLAANAPADTTE